ncbi:GNAT family N-acetyltransferase [Butyrivibrio sp. MB2005]|uniref:GNAT family N-acetyltransferase n=1 Tax=Butyrivibrio sp. MB2005 TaxID=1280678 RepID=UPI0003F6B53F|nr:GNAT family N-acetyltransferase [Butyrivibrio sp. MB2005]
MENLKITTLTPEYDLALAEIIRDNLKKHALDIPGTVYFDDNLNHLSDFYLADARERFYYILLDEKDRLVGGVGLAKFEFREDCAELQKIYLSDEVKGRGISYKLMSFIEDKARELGYKRMYLETHNNLPVAIHLYEKCGYKEIEKPKEVVHATMNRFFLKELYLE